MNLPKHIAIIVDGNRRWAKKRGLSLTAGHKKAAHETIDELIWHCLELKIPYVTFWCWSTENWKRGRKFSNLIFAILKQGLRKNVEPYIQKGVKLNTIGDLSKINHSLVQEIEKLKKRSQDNKKLTVTIALNYGGRDEIIRAIKRFLKHQITNNKLQTKKQFDNLTIEQFNNYLDTVDLPDPDLIIRTGGAKRLSGFLLWQVEYAEFYFTKTLFPDFNAKELDKALKEFSQQKRNFGV